MRHFRSSILLSLAGVLAGAAFSYYTARSMPAALEMGLITFALGLLEFSLSLDNAIVNATVLRHMDDKWRQRFLTWGIVIAVFGMRLIFPLLVVSGLTFISPWAALSMAITRPEEYTALVHSAKISFSGFGASFLLFVTLRFFLDGTKQEHWLSGIEQPLATLGRIHFAKYVVGLSLLILFSIFLKEKQVPFLLAAACGLALYMLLEFTMNLMQLPRSAQTGAATTGAFMFVYLEALDASFSMDGVIGAFAITHQLPIIVIGLGIGALYVRSFTLFLVERRTLERFRYLEHGAFYAVGALAAVLLASAFIELPEALTGLLGIAIIGLSLLSSVLEREEFK